MGFILFFYFQNIKPKKKETTKKIVSTVTAKYARTERILRTMCVFMKALL